MTFDPDIIEKVYQDRWLRRDAAAHGTRPACSQRRQRFEGEGEGQRASRGGGAVFL